MEGGGLPRQRLRPPSLMPPPPPQPPGLRLSEYVQITGQLLEARGFLSSIMSYMSVKYLPTLEWCHSQIYQLREV